MLCRALRQSSGATGVVYSVAHAVPLLEAHARAYAAPLHSCKYRRLRAPATNFLFSSYKLVARAVGVATLVATPGGSSNRIALAVAAGLTCM